MSDSVKSRDAIGVLPMPISLLPFEKNHRSPRIRARYSQHLSFNHMEDPRQSSCLIAIQLVSAFLQSKREAAHKDFAKTRKRFAVSESNSAHGAKAVSPINRPG